MFYCLSGKIITYDDTSVAISCGGVGFKCFTSVNTINNITDVGDEITLFTHLYVRDDSLDLYGFYTNEELECFRKLISVSGVGPKAAMSVLSVLTPADLALAVTTSDAKTITKAQGVGPKIAQRIILELKGKLSNISLDADALSDFSGGIKSASGNSEEAINALVMLGYSQSEASVAIAKLDSSQSVEDLLKQALKSLASGKF